MKHKSLLACAIASTLLLASAAIGQSNKTSVQSQPANAAPDRYPCRAVHTFDFWVGDFTATPWDQPNLPPRGTLHNTREYEGCVIVERWTAANGSNGMSMAFYDESRHAWRMIWNSDSNQSNDLEGNYADGAMRFTGWVLDSSGKRLMVKNVLQDVSPDVIRHTYSVSEDDGKTWIVKSDGRFERKHDANAS